MMFSRALNLTRRCSPLFIATERQLPQSLVYTNPLRHFAKGKDRGGSKKGGKPTMELRDEELAEVVNSRALREKMESAIQNLANQYQKQLTLTNPAGGLDTLELEFENSTVQLCEICQIQKKQNLVVLQFAAFPEAIKPAIKAIEHSGIPSSIQQEGTTVYLHLAKITREQREEMAKSAKEFFNKCKDSLVKLERKTAKEIDAHKQTHSKDLCFGATQQVKFEIEQTIVKAEQMMKAKQKELLSA